jgi:aspartyl/asparaginyl beta-hydroxylase (cupin superfamily)
MIDLPFINAKQMENIHPGLFITFGRALYVAQHFEANCRALATLLDVKGTHRSGKFSPSNEDADFNVFVDKLWKRMLAKNIGRLVNHYMPADLKDFLFPILDEARIARNYIAHNFTLGCETLVLEPEHREGLIEEIRKLVGRITEADKHICCIMQAVTHEPIPTGEYLQGYQEEIASWVCEPGETS